MVVDNSGALRHGGRNHLPTSTTVAPPDTGTQDLPAHTFDVGIVGETLLEPSTSLQASAKAAPRKITTYIRYPTLAGTSASETPSAQLDTKDGPYPLVVFSQGFDIAASAYSGLLDTWARYGFIVAEAVYPLTDPSDPNGVNRADLVNHPADLNFVIDTLLKDDSDPSSFLFREINSKEVVVAGHSDGGDVALAVTAGACCRNPLVRAGIILSGAEYAPFDTSYFTDPTPPLLLVQGTADTVNPEVCSNQIYDADPGTVYYVSLIGAEHLPPYTSDDSAAQVVDKTTLDFLWYITKGSQAALKALASDAEQPGVSTLIGEGQSLPLDGTCPGAP
jgi:pimeloyl-ACP methyl ester carboxylesterase